MSKIIVKEGDFEAAMKQFKNIGYETRKYFKRHEHHLRPKEMRELKKRDRIREIKFARKARDKRNASNQTAK